jgi:hypothetical protein
MKNKALGLDALKSPFFDVATIAGWLSIHALANAATLSKDFFRRFVAIL